MQVRQVKRSEGKSPVAAAAYRAGERLLDERQNKVFDFSHKTDVVHKEIMVPDNAPDWARSRKLTRESLWNMVDKRERRKDSQTAREIRIMLPRELSPEARIALTRAFVKANFVDLGMIADVTVHCPNAADGKEQPHAHVMLTMRPLTAEGFGDKSRHDWVPDPMGRTRADGKPVMVASNAASWNLATNYEKCRASFEAMANDALERAGSAERIDRRSYLERGLSRIPEPYLGIALHLKELHGALRERYGQFLASREYREVERRAKQAFVRLGQGQGRVGEAVRMAQRFHAWFDRMEAMLSNVPAPSREPPGLAPGVER